MSTPAAPASVVREGAGGPALPLVPVRAAVLLALAAFGGLHWMGMFAPAEPRRAWLAVGVAALVVVAMLGAARLPGLLRPVAAAIVAVVAIALALLIGGAADEQLRPEQWGALLTAVGRGIDALPGVNVPYKGVDRATMLAIGTGGSVMIVAAAVFAFWPCRTRTGLPAPALILLVALYAVPAVVLDFDGEFLRGALLALLLLAFLRLERLRMGDIPAAGAVAAIAAVAALAAAPVLDGREPWWDYESWAVDTAGARAVGFTWDHDYRPLDWPRDGRELLRVKARIPAYWKARDLDLFDGRTWRQDPRPRGEAVDAQLPDDVEMLGEWSQEIRVTLRNLRSDTFVAAGITTGIRGEASFPLGGGVFAAVNGLGKGDAYTADVYTPRPPERQLREAGTTYDDWLRAYRTVALPPPAGIAEDDPTAGALVSITWPGFDDPAPPEAVRIGTLPFEQVIADAQLGRIWALAQELKEGAGTPFEYVRRVEAHLRDGFAYSETPPLSASTLDGFLFDAKIGFCQQFSGAEALLLRMGGVPARIATGFTPGSYDEAEKEYVVRDLDAHSWVEAWFPGVGWVSRDPTPAAAPPRNQPGEGRPGGISGSLPGSPIDPGDRLNELDEGRTVASEEGGGTGWIVAGGVVLALGAVGLLVERRRRRRLPPAAQRPMLEFERALRRARFDGGPGLTLSRMERRFSGWPGAAGYVRTLREQRYSGRPSAPTSEQRRGLRAALARDAGVLRSWWAVPPRRGRRA